MPRHFVEHVYLVGSYWKVCADRVAGWNDWIIWRRSSRANVTITRSGLVARMICCVTRTTRTVVLMNSR